MLIHDKISLETCSRKCSWNRPQINTASHRCESTFITCYQVSHTSWCRKRTLSQVTEYSLDIIVTSHEYHGWCCLKSLATWLFVQQCILGDMKKITWASQHLKSPETWLCVQHFVLVNTKENIKGPYYCSFVTGIHWKPAVPYILMKAIWFCYILYSQIIKISPSSCTSIMFSKHYMTFFYCKYHSFENIPDIQTQAKASRQSSYQTFQCKFYLCQ